MQMLLIMLEGQRELNHTLVRVRGMHCHSGAIQMLRDPDLPFLDSRAEARVG